MIISVFRCPVNLLPLQNNSNKGRKSVGKDKCIMIVDSNPIYFINYDIVFSLLLFTKNALMKMCQKIPSKLEVAPPLKMWTGWMGDG